MQGSPRLSSMLHREHCGSISGCAQVKALVQVVPVVVPELELVRVAHLTTISTEMLSCTAEGARSYQKRCRMGNDVRVSLATASYFTGADYLQVCSGRLRTTIHHLPSRDSKNLPGTSSNTWTFSRPDDSTGADWFRCLQAPIMLITCIDCYELPDARHAPAGS